MSIAYVPSPDDTAVAVRAWVASVEALANGELDAPRPFGGSMADELELVTRELFDAHPITQVLVACTNLGA